MILEINHQERKDPTKLPLDRELKFSWEIIQPNILKVPIKFCLPPGSIPTNDYFTKFSELNLSSLELEKLQEEYEKLPK